MKVSLPQKLSNWWAEITGCERESERLRQERDRNRRQLLRFVAAVSNLEDELIDFIRLEIDGTLRVMITTPSPTSYPLLYRVVQGKPLVPPDGE